MPRYMIAANYTATGDEGLLAKGGTRAGNPSPP